MKDVWTDTVIQDLSDEDMAKFQEMVLNDVKNRCFNDLEPYILNNNLDLWLYCLQVLRREIELQLAQHKTNRKKKLQELYNEKISSDKIDSFLITEETWRNNAMKFLTSIERKTLYVKLLLQQEKD